MDIDEIKYRMHYLKLSHQKGKQKCIKDMIKNISANVVAYGSPCKVIREIINDDYKYDQKDQLSDIK